MKKSKNYYDGSVQVRPESLKIKTETKVEKLEFTLEVRKNISANPYKF